MKIGMLGLTTATSPHGSPMLRLSTPCAIDELEEVRAGQADLDRRDVEELRDFLEEWLR